MGDIEGHIVVAVVVVQFGYAKAHAFLGDFFVDVQGCTHGGKLPKAHGAEIKIALF